MNDNLPPPSNEQRIRKLERQVAELIANRKRAIETRAADIVRVAEVVDTGDTPLATTDTTRTGATVDARFLHVAPSGSDTVLTPRSANEQVVLLVASGDNPSAGDVGYCVRIEGSWVWLGALAT